MKKRIRDKHICPQCANDRFRTKKKGEEWQCLDCEYVKNKEEGDVVYKIGE